MKGNLQFTKENGKFVGPVGQLSEWIALSGRRMTDMAVPLAHSDRIRYAHCLDLMRAPAESAAGIGGMIGDR